MVPAATGATQYFVPLDFSVDFFPLQFARLPPDLLRPSIAFHSFAFSLLMNHLISDDSLSVDFKFGHDNSR